VKKNRTIIIISVVSAFVLLACGLLDTARGIANVAGEVRDLQERVEVGQPVEQQPASQDENKPQEVSGTDPDGFPLHPGAVRTWYMQLTEGDSKVTHVMYEVPLLPDEAYEYYQQELESHGWEITSTIHWGGTGYFITAGKDDGKEINLTFGDSQFPDHSTVNVQANY
jgi:predicted small secreted protein